MKRTNYLLKADVYAITDLLGCGDEISTQIGNEIVVVIDKLMELTNGTMVKVLNGIEFDFIENGLMCGNNIDGINNKKYRELYDRLELLFYRGYFNNKDILDFDELYDGLKEFKSCFTDISQAMNYDVYVDEYGKEIYKRNYIM